MKLAGKTILVTGATGGLGRAIAAELAGRGAVVVLSSRKPDELQALADELPGEGHRIVVADLSEPGAAERLVAEAGELDGIVLNAGDRAHGPVDELSAEHIERVIRVNLEAPVQMTRAVSPGLRARGEGHLVFIASLAGKAAAPRHILYGATKSGLRAFALSLRQDLARDGVGVSVINPGFIREAGMFARSGAKPPMNLGTSSPEEVGEAVAEAIEKDKAEIDVAPFRQRELANFALRFPHAAARVSGGVD
ncbi:MAG TPA: SDR family NAD(P)-dependent oxidoreductase [Solirubrobacterales bacterium]|nr:SDR family NAD(P)-dependent oxidoreductase [Solirubrobacterales bacterium]